MKLVEIEYIAYCPHAPESLCNVESQKLAFVGDWKSFRINLKGKYFIGDKGLMSWQAEIMDAPL